MLLDLFSGTGSVAKVYEAHGYGVVTVDWNKTSGATINEDILAWDYKGKFPVGYFDTIFAAVPCIEFSRALTTRPRDFDKGDAIVKKALAIIKHFKPKHWFLENPQTGKLKDRPYMEGIPYVDVDYCQFSLWGYQKPTRIWGGPDIQLFG